MHQAFALIVVSGFCLGLVVGQYSPCIENPEGPLHASCSIVWNVGRSCNESQQMIIDQMNYWNMDFPCGTAENATQPSGQKCLYNNTYNIDNVTYGTHTTPIQRYVDEMRWIFNPIPQIGCNIDAFSISCTTSVGDFGTNYCNLFNLMDGSGLTQDPLFEEIPGECTQYNQANCDIY